MLESPTITHRSLAGDSRNKLYCFAPSRNTPYDHPVCSFHRCLPSTFAGLTSRTDLAGESGTTQKLRQARTTEEKGAAGATNFCILRQVRPTQRAEAGATEQGTGEEQPSLDICCRHDNILFGRKARPILNLRGRHDGLGIARQEQFVYRRNGKSDQGNLREGTSSFRDTWQVQRTSRWKAGATEKWNRMRQERPTSQLGEGTTSTRSGWQARPWCEIQAGK